MNKTETPPPPSSLRARIETWTAEHASDFPPEIQRIFAERTEALMKSDIQKTCIQTGQIAPNFELPDSAGGTVGLASKISEGPVILSFYRGTWCPYCNLEFQAQLQMMPEFRACGAVVLAISPQLTNRRKEPAVGGFIDLCDRGNRVARSFGLVYPLGDEIKKIYQSFGIRLDELNGDDSYEVPLSASYIIDRNQKVRYAFVNPDFTQRAEPAFLLESLTQFATAPSN